MKQILALGTFRTNGKQKKPKTLFSSTHAVLVCSMAVAQLLSKCGANDYPKR